MSGGYSCSSRGSLTSLCLESFKAPSSDFCLFFLRFFKSKIQTNFELIVFKDCIRTASRISFFVSALVSTGFSRKSFLVIASERHRLFDCPHFDELSFNLPVFSHTSKVQGCKRWVCEYVRFAKLIERGSDAVSRWAFCGFVYQEGNF